MITWGGGGNDILIHRKEYEHLTNNTKLEKLSCVLVN